MRKAVLNSRGRRGGSHHENESHMNTCETGEENESGYPKRMNKILITIAPNHQIPKTPEPDH